MALVTKIIIGLFALSFVMIILVWNYSEKISINKNNISNDKIISNQNKIPDNEQIIKKQEEKYVVFIDSIINDYRVLIESGDKDIKNRELIKKLTSDFNNAVVPAKFKEVHLLFSRSLLRFSTYLDSLNQDDKASGTELFNQAEAKYKLLSNV